MAFRSSAYCSAWRAVLFANGPRAGAEAEVHDPVAGQRRDVEALLSLDRGDRRGIETLDHVDRAGLQRADRGRPEAELDELDAGEVLRLWVPVLRVLRERDVAAGDGALQHVGTGAHRLLVQGSRRDGRRRRHGEPVRAPQASD